MGVKECLLVLVSLEDGDILLQLCGRESFRDKIPVYRKGFESVLEYSY